MKQIVRFQNMVIPGKIRSEVRITIDERNIEYSSLFEGNKSTSIVFYPIVTLTMVKASSTDENGNKIKAPWNPNDSLGMTKYNLPILVRELKEIEKDMKIPELYTYHGKRLELNESIAEDKVRRVFMIGNVTLELSAVVIVQDDESRIEGIKMKFNNEQSSVLLTLNELTSLIYNLDHLDVDSVALMLYMNYITKPDKPTTFDSSSLQQPVVDILPKDNFT